MCAIFGIINPEYKHINIDLINRIIKNSAERGTDGFGYVLETIGGKTIQQRSLNSAGKFEGLTEKRIKFLVGNTRAEPTTEYIENKKTTDQQPYKYQDTTIVHNGTISNDRVLKENYEFKTQTDIDSYVISVEMDKIDFNDFNAIKNTLVDTLIGSYATLIHKENYVLAATNYKPLYLLKENGIYYIASLEHFFGDYNNVVERPDICEIPPYTLIRFNLDTGEITQGSLYKSNTNKKALICASSGLDSTTAIAWALDNGFDVTLLHFNYECRAWNKEKESIKNISEYYKLPLYTINVDFFKNVIGGSKLYDGSDITKTGETGAELAIEWVPARNLIFLSIAAGFCEAHDLNYLILGGNLEESGAYADNEYIFQKKFNDLLPNSLNLQHQLQILTPLANLMKRDIVQMGLELKAPLNLTWSCYENGEKHCGKCGPCFMRRTAFKMLNQNEVIEYES
jgi:7-cyano-7-deazaguanine synthase